MRYVEARIEENTREEAYRIYVTRSLQLIPQNSHLTTNFSDIIKPKEPEKKKDNNPKTGDDIAWDIINRAGLMFGE